jgi:hypothetical protein
MTDFDKVCEILGTLYANFKEDTDLKDFIDFNDLGLPLAYFVSESLAEVSDDGARYITETWQLFLASMDLEDNDWDSLDEMFAAKIEGTSEE